MRHTVTSTQGRSHSPSSVGCPSSRFAGFIPTTMLDWPGRVASTVFLGGCTLRCPYCHNPELLSGADSAGDWEGLLSHLSVRRGWIDGVVVSGGEPTADPDLGALLEAFATRGVPVKLDTNGTAPDVLERLLEDSLVEYVALDVKTFPEHYGVLGAPDSGAAVARCIDMLVHSGVTHEFRTTVYPPIITADDLPRLASRLRGGDAYVIQQFRPGHTLDPRAAMVTASHPVDLREAAALCSRYVPTTTRGV